MSEMEDVIVIGSGPAGLTAALYAARANLNPLVITGSEIGGQVSITNEVENYPGFPDGATGPELVQLMQKQAERFGARFEIDEVKKVHFTQGSPFWLKTNSKEYEAKTVIICTGATPRRLGIPGEEANIGKGVSFCATCDGFFFRGRDVVVVGGGDSALEEGLFLTRFVDSLRIIHRRDELRAGATLQRRARENEKISFVWDTVVEEITSDGAVQAVKVKNVKTGEKSELATDGVFIYIGHIPNSWLFKEQLEMDQAGYLTTDRFMQTSVPGVFAAGEIQDPYFRQVATSVGQGCAAAMQCEKWLAEEEDRAYPGR
jgi:thioredoxin reductase (NADPH)